MNTDRIDLGALPEMKISQETFDVLAEFSGDNFPTAVNGATWKRLEPRTGSGGVFVICRYR